MKTLGIALVLGLLAGAWAMIAVERPPCDSPEAEEAALVAQDYLNAQHNHGYKYVLNRIEDIKVYTTPAGDTTYVLEVDLLETQCHVLDPTPLANCTVRPKVLTAVEGDCDVVLKRVAGALAVTAFKCKTEESTEDMCLGCPLLLPLNNTDALNLVQASVATFNNMTENENTTYMLTEVGRMTSQIVSGGPIFSAEYVIFEANCTGDACEPLADATRGFCTASGSSTLHSVACKMFLPQVSVVDATAVDANDTAAPAAPAVTPGVHVHTDSLSRKHGMLFHKLTSFHNPQLNEFLSAESAESAEVVPVMVDAGIAAAAPAAADPAPAVADPAPAVADPAPAVADPAPAVDSGSASDSSTSGEVPVVVVKRDVPAAPVVDGPVLVDPIVLVPLCPGKVRHF